MTTQVSTYVTNSLRSGSSGVVMNAVGTSGTTHVKKGFITINPVLALNDIVILCELPWEAHVHSIKLFATDLDSGGSALVTSLGIYSLDKAQTTYTATASGCYLTGCALGAAASYTGNEATATFAVNSVRTVDLINNRVVDDAGLSPAIPPTDGSVPVLALTVTTGPTTGATGKIGFIVEYTV